MLYGNAGDNDDDGRRHIELLYEIIYKISLCLQ